MIEMQSVYEQGLLALHESNDRGDSELLHIGGDLAGLCDRAGWARRRLASSKLVWDSLTEGFVDPAEHLREALRTPESVTGMQLGFAVEALVLDALARGLPDGRRMQTNVCAALVLTDEGLQGRLFSDDTRLVAFAARHANVAVGHIDAIVRNDEAGELLVLDVKSTVWGDSWKSGERVWSQKYPPKESHVLQVSAYALAVSLEYPDAVVSAGLFELDLGGKGTRFSPVDWQAEKQRVGVRLREALALTDPADEQGPPARPNPWTVREDGTSWACGSIDDRGRVRRGYCGLTSCPSHVLNTGEQA
jgi:hypothetical protein